MSTRRKTGKTFAPVAALEQRALLTTGGLTDVVITGDNSSNSVTIVQNSVDVYTLKGLSGTKINGVAGRTFTFRFNQFDDLRISLNGGDDYLSIYGNSATPRGDLDITDDLAINMGSGKDVVNLKFLEIKGDLSVDMGSGDDKLNVKNTVLHGSSNLIGGDGIDDLNFFSNSKSMTFSGFKSPTFKNIWY